MAVLKNKTKAVYVFWEWTWYIWPLCYIYDNIGYAHNLMICMLNFNDLISWIFLENYSFVWKTPRKGLLFGDWQAVKSLVHFF